MKPLAIFGINVLASFVSSVAAAVLFAMPWLQAQNTHVALLWLVVPHMFLRFIGVQWDGQNLTYESDNAAQSTISRLSISGSSAEVIGQTRLKKVRRWLWQSWTYKDSVIAPYSNSGEHGNILGIWKYPGGSSIKVVTKFGDFDRRTFSFTGATISIAP